MLNEVLPWQITQFRDYFVKNNRSEKVEKLDQIFENLRRLVSYLTRVFRNMDDFASFEVNMF